MFEIVTFGVYKLIEGKGKLLFIHTLLISSIASLSPGDVQDPSLHHKEPQD